MLSCFLASYKARLTSTRASLKTRSRRDSWLTELNSSAERILLCGEHKALPHKFIAALFLLHNECFTSPDLSTSFLCRQQSKWQKKTKTRSQISHLLSAENTAAVGLLTSRSHICVYGISHRYMMQTWYEQLISHYIITAVIMAPVIQCLKRE